jgi:hypothetical protein
MSPVPPRSDMALQHCDTSLWAMIGDQDDQVSLLARVHTLLLDREQTPLIADPFERVRPAISELDSRAGYEVPDRA